jgi:hypothetical protein
MLVKKLKDLGFRVGERKVGGGTISVLPKRDSTWECVAILLDINMLQH